MSIQAYWTKFVSRTEDVLHWDSSISVRRETLEVGPVRWGTRNDLALKNGTPLPTWYEHVTPVEEQTNIGDFCNEVSPLLDKALQDAIAIVDRDLTALPGTTREEAGALYERFRLDMGLMLFGLVCNAVPVARLRGVLGDKFEQFEEAILRPYRPTLLGREARSIYQAQNESDGKSVEWFQETSKRLAEEFGFVHSEYVSESWDVSDYERALRGTRMEIVDPDPVDESTFSDYEKWLISIVQKLSYLHDEGKTALVRTNWALRSTLRNLGLDDRILHLSEQEFRRWVQNGEKPSDDVLAKRDHYFAILSQGDTYRFYFGKDEVSLFSQDQGLIEATLKTEIHKFRGSIASKGRVNGRVRIVTTQEESNKVVEGDILVASMTTPAYISAMRLASAYVTDEGGVICHAAIVSREFKKPCIVGTKIATQVLRDGDLVEVDADNGTVRILERSGE